MNFLGHFVLTNLIFPYLSPDAHIVNVTGNMHNPNPSIVGSEIFYPGAESLAFPNRIQALPVMIYSISKLCNLYFTYELVRKLKGRNIRVNAFNPGLMIDSGFHKNEQISHSGMTFSKDRATSAEICGQRLADLVIGEKWSKSNGIYDDKGVETKSSELSYDLENAKDLWEVSQRLSQIQSAI